MTAIGYRRPVQAAGDRFGYKQAEQRRPASTLCYSPSEIRMSLKQSMEVISRLSEEAAIRDADLIRQHGLELGLRMGDPASEAYVREAKSITIPLEDYLKGLELSEIKKLVTLMYAGRDTSNFQEAGSLRTFHGDLTRGGVHDKSKAEYIRTILEKMPGLPVYFSSISSQLRSMNADPDDSLAGID